MDGIDGVCGLQIEMGHGDVFVTGGLIPGDDGDVMSCVTFRKTSQRGPIGRRDSADESPRPQGYVDARIVFADARSIDVVIMKLQLAKAYMAVKSRRPDLDDDAVVKLVGDVFIPIEDMSMFVGSPSRDVFPPRLRHA